MRNYVSALKKVMAYVVYWCIVLTPAHAGFTCAGPLTD